MMRELPPDVAAAIDRASDYIARLGVQRTPELITEWGAIHADLIAAGNELRALAGRSSQQTSHTSQNVAEQCSLGAEADGRPPGNNGASAA
jgi:hypothetical protein